MTEIKDDEDEDDDDKDNDDDDEEGEDDDEETILRSWEVSDGLNVELHDCDDHLEVLATECDEDDKESIVVLAFSIEDLDATIKALGEVRAEMEKRQKN
jgi:hypothetical protein